MQQFRTVARNNRFPSLAPDVPGRHFPQRNQVSGKIRVAGSKIFSWAAHGACFQRNNTVHSAFIGGGEESASGTKSKKKNWRRKNTLPSFSTAKKLRPSWKKGRASPFLLFPFAAGEGESLHYALQEKPFLRLPHIHPAKACPYRLNPRL